MKFNAPLLFALRKHFNFTQQELGTAAHISGNQIAKLERGECSNITFKTVESIALVFRINPTQLVINDQSVVEGNVRIAEQLQKQIDMRENR